MIIAHSSQLTVSRSQKTAADLFKLAPSEALALSLACETLAIFEVRITDSRAVLGEEGTRTLARCADLAHVEAKSYRVVV